jgi:hypothetical protein
MALATDSVVRILKTCGTDAGVLPPTSLFNEGWMLRLVLDWFSRQTPSDHPLSFAARARWYSEALLRSQFRARRRGDPHAEAWTHADGVIGHFHIRRGRGDVELDGDAQQLVVTEAKLFSGLSAGTTRAREFNQAARNVACIAELMMHRDIRQLARLAFVVLAPEEQIGRGVFGEMCNRDHVARTVAARVGSYEGEKDKWHVDVFLPTLRRIELRLLSWEEILAYIVDIDHTEGAPLSDFYSECLRFNRPRGDQIVW